MRKNPNIQSKFYQGDTMPALEFYDSIFKAFDDKLISFQDGYIESNDKENNKLIVDLLSDFYIDTTKLGNLNSISINDIEDDIQSLFPFKIGFFFEQYAFGNDVDEIMSYDFNSSSEFEKLIGQDSEACINLLKPYFNEESTKFKILDTTDNHINISAHIKEEVDFRKLSETVKRRLTTCKRSGTGMTFKFNFPRFKYSN